MNFNRNALHHILARPHVRNQLMLNDVIRNQFVHQSQNQTSLMNGLTMAILLRIKLHNCTMNS